MTAPEIVIAAVLFLVGAALVIAEIHDARREMAHLPVAIDRYTKATRARAKQHDRTG